MTTVGRAVASDPALSVQLLRVVNSSLYNRGAKIASIDRAVAILGSRTLRNLALCVAAQNCVRGDIGDFDLDGFWEDSLRRAVAARQLAEAYLSGEVDPNEAFTIGLLQDLGVVGLVMTAPERASAWMAVRGRMHEDRRRVEQETFGLTHDDVAVSLIEAWALPPDLAIPILHHHRPARAPAELRSRCMLAGQAELLAQVLRSDDKRAALGAARAGLGRELGLTAAQVDGLVAEVGARVKDIGQELGFRVGRQPTMEDILAAANAGLVELNLTYEELVRRLEQSLAETEALTKELAVRNRELEQLSVTDALTSLPNRRALSGRLSYELGRASREGTSLAFVMCDIDRFKLVNDTWGHDFGDVVLKEAARVLRSAADDSFACRVGGEEFGIVIPGATPAEATKAAERVRAAVGGNDVVCPDGVRRRFTISLGVAWMAAGAPATVDPDVVAGALYKNADRALYEAKRQGRDRVVAATDATPWAVTVKAA